MAIFRQRVKLAPHSCRLLGRFSVSRDDQENSAGGGDLPVAIATSSFALYIEFRAIRAELNNCSLWLGKHPSNAGILLKQIGDPLSSVAAWKRILNFPGGLGPEPLYDRRRSKSKNPVIES
jgi:hypothetical protein